MANEQVNPVFKDILNKVSKSKSVFSVRVLRTQVFDLDYYAGNMDEAIDKAYSQYPAICENEVGEQKIIILEVKP